MEDNTHATFEGHYTLQQPAATSATLAVIYTGKAATTTAHHSPTTTAVAATVHPYLSHAERGVMHDLLGQPGALVLGAVLAQPGREPGHALEALRWCD
jgi:hypothetical protein